MKYVNPKEGSAMRWTTTLALLAAVGVLGIAAYPETDKQTVEPDPVLESFERDMNREPTPTAPIRRDDIERDRLYEMINSVHWTHAGPEDLNSSQSAGRNEDEEPKTDS
jgi:hypothetical protein